MDTETDCKIEKYNKKVKRFNLNCTNVLFGNIMHFFKVLWLCWFW